jgi:hypothetical protein
MKNIFFLLITVFYSVTFVSDGNLFDNISFHNGRAELSNIPVVYESIGRNPYDMGLFSNYGVNIKSHTALEFSYNNVSYYLPIDNEVSCDFIDTCQQGESLYIDIIVFDTINSRTTQRCGVKIYHSYITAIRR